MKGEIGVFRPETERSAQRLMDAWATLLWIDAAWQILSAATLAYFAAKLFMALKAFAIGLGLLL